MCGGEPARGWKQHVEHLAPTSPLLTQPLPERPAFDELHGEEDVAVQLTDVVDRQHVGVGEPRHRARLAKEALAHLFLRFLRRSARPQHLERDRTAQLRVARGIDDSHSAGADWPEHLVSGDCFRIRDRHGGRVRDELNEDPAAHFAGAQMPFRLRQPLGRETTIDVLEQILFRDAAHGSRPQVARDATAVYTTKDGL